MKGREALTRSGLHETLMLGLGLGKKDAGLLVETFLESIIQSLRAGEGVELRGFGSFRLRDRPARIGRNPLTGESVEVPPKRVAYFKIGKELRYKLVDE
jgi:integration host factor subunit beta